MKEGSSIGRLLAHPRLPWVVFAIAFVLSLPSILVDFSSDDHFVRMVVRDFPGMPEIAEQDEFHTVPWDLFAFATGREDYNKQMMARGLLPWWTYPEMRQRVMHPLTGPTHAFDDVVFGDNSLPMHLQNIFWFALVAFPAALFYRKLTGTALAGGIAVWLYMIDDARGMPIGWIANRHIFHAVALGFLMMYGHYRWRIEGWKPGLIIAPVCLALGFACGEAMAAVVAYLVAFELFLAKDSWPRRAISLAPYAAVVLLWRFIYTNLGFGTFGSGIYIDMGKQPLLYLEKVASHLPVLLLAMWGKPNSTWWTFMPPNVQLIWIIAAVAFLLILVAFTWRTLREDAIARFAFVGAIVAALPLCATIADDRLLIFPSIGGALFIARVFYLGYTWKPFVVVLVFIHVVLAPMLLPIESMRQGLITVIGDRANEGIPEERYTENDTIVVFNPPSDWLPTLFPMARSGNRETVPRHFFALTAGGGASNVTRENETTFLLTQEDGMLPYPYGQLHRNINLAPWKAGDMVEIPGLRVDILEVTDDNRPSTIRCTLDPGNGEIHLYEWDGFTYVPFDIAVNDAVDLPAPQLNGPFAKRHNSE